LVQTIPLKCLGEERNYIEQQCTENTRRRYHVAHEEKVRTGKAALTPRELRGSLVPKIF